MTQTQDQLTFAILCQDSQAAQTLLTQQGASAILPDSAGQFPLCEALRMHQEKIVTLLLEHPTLNVEAEDEWGNTALHAACAAEYQYGVEQLLLKGAQINHANKQGMTPLHVSVQVGNQALAEFLLTNGANVNAVLQDDLYYEQHQMTALHIAALANNLQLIRLLVQWGADSAAKTQEGQTVDKLFSDASQLNELQEILRMPPTAFEEYQRRIANSLSAFGETTQAAEGPSISNIASTVTPSLPSSPPIQPAYGGIERYATLIEVIHSTLHQYVDSVLDGNEQTPQERCERAIYLEMVLDHRISKDNFHRFLATLNETPPLQLAIIWLRNISLGYWEGLGLQRVLQGYQRLGDKQLNPQDLVFYMSNKTKELVLEKRLTHIKSTLPDAWEEANKVINDRMQNVSDEDIARLIHVKEQLNYIEGLKEPAEFQPSTEALDHMKWTHRLMHSLMLVQTGQFGVLTSELETTLCTHPLSPTQQTRPIISHLYTLLGIAYTVQGQLDKAINVWQANIRLIEKETAPIYQRILIESYNNLANVSIGMGKVGEGLAHKEHLCDVLAGRDPMSRDLAVAYNELAVTYTLNRHAKNGILNHQKAIEASTRFPDLQIALKMNLALAYALHKDMKTAYQLGDELQKEARIFTRLGQKLAFYQKLIGLYLIDASPNAMRWRQLKEQLQSLPDMDRHENPMHIATLWTQLGLCCRSAITKYPLHPLWELWEDLEQYCSNKAFMSTPKILQHPSAIFLFFMERSVTKQILLQQWQIEKNRLCSDPNTYLFPVAIPSLANQLAINRLSEKIEKERTNLLLELLKAQSVYSEYGASQVHPEIIVHLYFAIADLQEQMGMDTAAHFREGGLTIINKYIHSVSPGFSPDLMHKAGWALQGIGRFRESIACYNNAIIMQMTMPNPMGVTLSLVARTIAHLRLGEYSEAIEGLEHSLTFLKVNLPPFHPEITFTEHFLKQAYACTIMHDLAQKTQNPPRAKQLYHAILQIAPKDAIALERMARLQVPSPVPTAPLRGKVGESLSLFGH